MTAEIVDLAAHRLPGDTTVIVVPNRGNGAREAAIDIALKLPSETTLPESEVWADWLLAALWSRGFKVIPVDAT